MKYIVSFFLFIGIVFLFEPSYAEKDDIDTDDGTEKQEKSIKKEEKKKKKEDETIPKKQEKEGLSELRMQVIKEAAKEYGFQKGFSEAYDKIQKRCEQKTRELDQMYPFEQVLLENGTVQPPVIVKADDFSTIPNPETMIRTGTAYRIIRSAEFVSMPPSWRTYLLIPEEALTPQEVAQEILPKTRAEKKAWQEEYAKAYTKGATNAREYFQEEMARLKREFLGMIEYHILHRQGKISLPNISRGHYDVRISDDTMEIDQRTFIITDRPHFQNKKNWRAIGK